jgi:hypothetical protein
VHLVHLPKPVKDGAVALAANEEAGQAMPLGLAAEGEGP